MRSITGCLAIIGMVVTAGPALGQAQPNRTVTTPDSARSRELAARNPAWQAFLTENGPNWRASWNFATETPKAVYGVGMRVGTANEHPTGEESWAVLHRYRDLLGAGESTYQQAIATEVNGVHIYVYDQYYRGLPVIGGRVDVRINRGVLAMFGSQSFPIPDGFDTTPALGSGQAEAQAYLALEVTPSARPRIDPDPPEPARLVIWGDAQSEVRSPVRLAWEVAVDALDQGVAGRAYVDAGNGALLHYETDVHQYASEPTLDPVPEESAPEVYEFSGTVRAWALAGLSPFEPPQNLRLPNVLVTIPNVGTTYTNAQGRFELFSTFNRPSNVTIELTGLHVKDIDTGRGLPLTQTIEINPDIPVQFQLTPPDADEFELAQSTAYWHVDDINDYIRGILLPSCCQTELDVLDGIEVNVNLFGSCNAFYRTTLKTINFLGSGSVCPNTSYSTILYHEWGHALDDIFGGVSPDDGLAEGWADAIAAYRTGQPIQAQDIQGIGTFGRTALNSRQYPGGSCGINVHCRGESWSGFGWQVRERLRGALGPVAGTTHAERIVLGSLQANATNQPDAVREVFILDDDDGNLLNGTPNYLTLLAAAEHHNLPFPVRDSVALTHTTLEQTELPYTPRVVRVTATPLFSSPEEMRVSVTSQAGLPMTRTMIPSGNPDEYVALLPAFGIPLPVRYAIEAVDTDGGTTRIPRIGHFVYDVLGTLPDPEILYVLEPDQTPLGSTMTLTANGPPNTLAAVLISMDPGPTALPGIPALSVGPAPSIVPLPIDATGVLFGSFAAPTDPALVGNLLYSQLVALDGNNVVVSNQRITLFTQ